MINLGRFSVAMLPPALLFCAFAVASQDKNAPSNVEKNPPSNVVLEDHFEKLQADFLKIKQELEQKLDTTNRRLDSIEQLTNRPSCHQLPVHYRHCLMIDLIIMICNRVAGASITT